MSKLFILENKKPVESPFLYRYQWEEWMDSHERDCQVDETIILLKDGYQCFISTIFLGRISEIEPVEESMRLSFFETVIFCSSSKIDLQSKSSNTWLEAERSHKEMVEYATDCLFEEGLL